MKPARTHTGSEMVATRYSIHSLCLLVSVAPLLVPSEGSSATFHVPQDFPTIQQAIDVAANEDTVLVAPGTYQGAGNCGFTFRNRNTSLVSEGGPDVTTLFCQDETAAIVTRNGEAPLIQGFTVTRAVQGLLVDQDATPLVRDCVFTSNANGSNGGKGTFQNCSFMSNTATGLGIGSNTTVSDCVFIGNTGSVGGAINAHGNGLISRCTFINNSAFNGPGGAARCAGGVSISFVDCFFGNNIAVSLGGGAIYGQQSSITVTRCVFYQNRALSGLGGAIGCSGSSNCQVDKSTFHSNWALAGAGIGLIQSSSAVISNTIITASPVGDGVFCGDQSNAQVECSDIWGNGGGDWAGCLGGQLGQDGNLSLDPMFCDIVNDDFHVHAASPCAPSNSPPGCGLIGALPVGCGVANVAAEEAPSVDLRLTVFPNPVRGVARFELGHVTPLASLNIYDLQGRLVEQLMRQDGHWAWTPGPAVPAGIYFATPEDGMQSLKAVKFLYLR